MSATVFSTRLQALRKERGVTQEQLASHLGVSPQAVSKWEKNGSYPDGDLLPRLADYFGVSIDYLYGRAERNPSVEKQIAQALSQMANDSFGSVDDPGFFDKLLSYCWAIQCGFWKGVWNDNDLNIPVETWDEGKSVYASISSGEAGITFMRLNTDLQYYMAVKCPDKGFAKAFPVTEKLIKLFAFLGKADHVKTLFYMMSLNGTDKVKAQTVARRLGFSEKTVRDILKVCCEMDFVYESSILDEYDRQETIYGCNRSQVQYILMLLTVANTVINPPEVFKFQISHIDKGRLNRDDLDFLKKNTDGSLKGE